MSDETKQAQAEPKQETDLSARMDAIESTLGHKGYRRGTGPTESPAEQQQAQHPTAPD